MEQNHFLLRTSIKSYRNYSQNRNFDNELNISAMSVWIESRIFCALNGICMKNVCENLNIVASYAVVYIFERLCDS